MERYFYLDRLKSLQDLDEEEWGKSNFGSYLLTRAYELHKIPIGHFSVEDLRLMIGQKIGLEYLVPLAIEELGEDPLISGNYLPGDLLNAVLKVEQGFWDEHLELKRDIEEILASTIKNLTEALEGFRLRNNY